MSFLIGLNDSFAQIRGQILLSDPLPPIGNDFSLVIQEEAQREIVVNHIPSLNSNNIWPLLSILQPRTLLMIRVEIPRKRDLNVLIAACWVIQ